MEEIEHIKTSSSKDADIKYKARKLSRLLDEHWGEYTVSKVTYSEAVEIITGIGLEESNDTIILATAFTENQHSPILFVSDDINCKGIARMFFNLKTKGIEELNLVNKVQEYTGFKEVTMSDEEMASFYSTLKENRFNCYENQYLIIRNQDNEVVDKRKWTGTEYSPVFDKTIKSMYFEKLRPKDAYQACALDSLLSNTITAISGKAGSGKTLLSLMVAMNLIETGAYERIVVMFNPTKTRGSSDLGYYAGDFITKAMNNSIGQILITKFGDRFAVDMLLQQEKIKLVSMADARGMEIKDSEILWITECQNTSVELIKLCLSRVSSGAKIFLEGDYGSQTDSIYFEGANNGLKRVIDVFTGQSEFGYIQLQKAWRSKIAELCELL